MPTYAPERSAWQRRGEQRHGWLAAGWTVVAVATSFCVFVLPFFFPLHEPVLSASYLVGADNRVGAVTAALIGAVVTLVCWRFGVGGRASEQGEGLGRRYLAGGIATAVLFTAALGWLITRSHLFWGDEGYFLTQLRTGIVFHRALYRGFEFPYGPVLYLWPAAFIRALGPLGIAMQPAYLISLAVMQAVGTALLYYVIEALPMRRALKAWLYVLVIFGMLTVLMAPNYSIFRFILPLAGVVLLSRQRSVGAGMAVAGLGEMAQLAVSPELGVAFAGGAVVYAIYRTVCSSRRWAWVAAATFAGAGVFAGLAGRDYFLTMGKVAKGGFNLLLQPIPHLVVFILGVVALAPLAVARGVRRRDVLAGETSGESRGRLDLGASGMLIGLYVTSLGLLPAALGRCDPLHVFFDGLGIFLLSFVAIDRWQRRWQMTWVVAVGLVFLVAQVANTKIYQENLRRAFGRSHDTSPPIDVRALEATIGSAKVSAPLLMPESVLEALIQTGQYRPGYFCNMMGVWDREAEQKGIADMREAEFVLVPRSGLLFMIDVGNHGRYQGLVGLGQLYHARYAPLIQGALTEEELRRNWGVAGLFGNYVLYRKHT